MIPAPKNCTSFKTRKLTRLLARHYDAEFAKLGIKSTQFTLLAHVIRYEPVSAGALAQRMGIDASTLTRNINLLVHSGWLEQSIGEDARSRNITTTSEGRKFYEVADLHWNNAQEKINALLGIERVTALTKLIDECLDLLKEEDKGVI